MEPPSELAPDLSGPTTLLLIRHGLTPSTGRDFTGGDDLGPSLDNRGRWQADQLASALVDQYAPLSALVSSPLRRTRETAEFAALDLAIDVHEDDGWREVSSLAPADVEELLPRVAAARDRLLAAHRGGVVAVVTHAGPIKAVVAQALDAGPAALWRLRIDPASISTLRCWADGGVEVAAVNDTSHLL